ncbi:MAG: pimeloyl-ACP methyl ester carboxylesterase [Candidatus Krumholzibacteriia bacterium]|jgi:pimeloyl-ACP methyl ester carboxylesterase
MDYMNRYILTVLLVLSCAPGLAVELEVSVADTKLAGTLHQPTGLTSYPVVVFTHGSEPGERGSRGYLRWADVFIAQGIGVLIFDKRGCGDSEGQYIEAPDLAIPAADLSAWVDLLVTRAEVTEVGVLGWSQGGWVGPLAASQNQNVSFVVSLSGPGVSPLQQNIYDKTNQFAATGASTEHIKLFEEAIRQVWTYMVTGDNILAAQQAWDKVADSSWFLDALNGPPMMDRDQLLQHPRMPHYVQHSSFQPVPIYEKMEVPMLAIFGGSDTIVPVAASIAAMRGGFRAQPDLLTIQIVPKAGHGLNVPGHKLAPSVQHHVVSWTKEIVSR